MKESKTRKKHNEMVALHSDDHWVPIGAGSYYKGKWNHRTMSGNGLYIMTDGNLF